MEGPHTQAIGTAVGHVSSSLSSWERKHFSLQPLDSNPGVIPLSLLNRKIGRRMVDATRALLDELMGKDRNLHPAERKNDATHFWDEDICKYYICGFCPHDLFTNTKNDLGKYL